MTSILTYGDNEALRQMIDGYIELGHVIIPLKDKVPLTNNWQKQTSSDRRQFKGHSSFGFRIPDHIVVLDVDNHKGSNIGNESLAKLSNDLGFDFYVQAAFKVKTAGKGYHLYFTLMPIPETKIVNALPEYPGLEFKSKGRQVVIPESVLSNGTRYQHLGGALRELTPLPQSLYEKITTRAAPKVSNTSENGKVEFSDLPTDIAMFKASLASQPMVEDGTRNNRIFNIACLAKDFGLSPRKLLPILTEWQYGNVHPPLEVDELKTTIVNAYGYSTNEVGVRSLKSVFGNPKVVSPEPQKKEQEVNAPKVQRMDDEDAVQMWSSQLILTKQGAVSKTHFGTRNTEIYLENLPIFRGKLAVNLFTMDTVWLEMPEWRQFKRAREVVQEITNVEDEGKIDPQPALNDDDIVVIRGVLNTVANFDPSPAQIYEATRAVALRNAFHPVKDYFEALPEWDGVERLSKFFTTYCGTPDNVYYSEVAKKLFTAVVTRIYIPGAKFDYTAVFFGDQGQTKSKIIKIMAIKPNWFADSLGDIENKDVILQMRGKLVIENAEMAMTTKKVQAITKAFLSRSTDRARMPYERLPRDVARQCIFISTTNEDRFLQDETGDRRFWPIEIGKLNEEGIRANLDLFYAEAFHLYKKGEFLYLKPEVEAMARELQAAHFNGDEWQDVIEKYLAKEKIDFVQGIDLWKGALGRTEASSFDIKSQKRISNILKHLKWKSAFKSIDGRSVRGYKKGGVK